MPSCSTSKRWQEGIKVHGQGGAGHARERADSQSGRLIGPFLTSPPSLLLPHPAKHVFTSACCYCFQFHSLLCTCIALSDAVEVEIAVLHTLGRPTIVKPVVKLAELIINKAGYSFGLDLGWHCREHIHMQ